METGQFVVWLLIGLVIGILMAVAASKVGRSPVLWFILGVIPICNLFFVGIATWSVLIDVHRRLKAMEMSKVFG
jgi:hypothetical protein